MSCPVLVLELFLKSALTSCLGKELLLGSFFASCLELELFLEMFNVLSDDGTVS